MRQLDSRRDSKAARRAVDAPAGSRAGIPAGIPAGSRRSRACAIAMMAGAVATTGALVLPMTAGATATGTALSPAASSTAEALVVTVPKLTLITGAGLTSATRGGFLLAKGAGVLKPSPKGEVATEVGPGRSEPTKSTCGGSLPAFPAPFAGIISASVACGSAGAHSLSSSSGSTSATGKAASLTLDLSSVLGQLIKPASAAAASLAGVIGQLPPLPAGGEPVSAVLQKVNAALTGNLSIAVDAGTSTSSSVVTPSGWTTEAKAGGGVITILPKGGLNGAPLAKIIIGAASASASVSRPPATGGVQRPTATDTPALVTVEVDAPAVGPQTYSLVPGQSITILKGTPLQSTISVAAGSVTTSASGAVTAQANAVSIALAEGVGASPSTAENGGLHLGFAAVTATAVPESVIIAAKKPHKAHTPPTTVPKPVPNATVPHTGLPWAGAVPILAGAALTGTGLLWWPRLRRRIRAASSGHAPRR
ncbi:MAG: hypothetical protein ACYDGN_13345 [Acidimicrobiales bacterium]